MIYDGLTTKQLNLIRIAEETIKVDLIPKIPQERISLHTEKFLEGDFCVDVHTHFFDMKSINSSYMILRLAKDILGIRGDQKELEEHYVKEAYKKVDTYTDTWNHKLQEILIDDTEKRGGRMSFLLNVLGMSKVEQVYNYYINDASLAPNFGLEKEKVLTTVLMMDFKMGWGVKVGKSMATQIEELKKLANKKPVLPFLFCDPRRAELTASQENLYGLFNKAFAEGDSFFGVKIYPCLGYDPSDYRLWPIYKICEELHIPVLSHCGGTTVSTAETKLRIYEGKEEVEITGENRKEVGDQLNDPNRWKRVLEKFPDLRLNIAHFGSNGTWETINALPDQKDPQHRKETIMQLMRDYDNVYSDFSYTITDEKASRNFIAMLHSKDLLQERSMFGTDYWVVYQEGSLENNQKKFLDMVGDDELRLALCKKNPMAYLFGEEIASKVSI